MRPSALRPGEAVLVGVGEQRQPAVDAELFVDRGEVVAQGVLADVQLLRDRPRVRPRMSRGNGDDLPLPLGERKSPTRNR